MPTLQVWLAGFLHLNILPFDQQVSVEGQGSWCWFLAEKGASHTKGVGRKCARRGFHALPNKNGTNVVSIA